MMPASFLCFGFIVCSFLFSVSEQHGHYAGSSSAQDYYRSVFFARLHEIKIQTCQKQSLGTSPVSIGTYDRIFTAVIDGDFAGFTQDKSRFKGFQYCLGRRSDEDIVAEGRRGLDFYFNRFGIDIRSEVSDADFLDGKVNVLNGTAVFQSFIFAKDAKYRIVSETKGPLSASYRNNLIADGGWIIQFGTDIDIDGPGFKGKIGAGGAIFYGDYQFYTELDGPRRLVSIHYENVEPTRLAGGHFFFFEATLRSKDFGEGLTFGLYDADFANGKVNGREIYTFPGQV